MNRVEYVQVGVTSPHCLGLLPASSHKPRKVVVADQQGVVTCFGIKKREPSLVFKSLPMAKISRVELVKEKIFVAANTEVHGLSKKGKTFFSISTFMSEPINSMQVREQHLYLAGDYVFSHYFESKDQNFYLAGDRINDLLCTSISQEAPGQSLTGSSSVLPVLACSDSSLRIIEGSELLLRVELSDAPLCLTNMPAAGSVEGGVLYGTNRGAFGLAQLARGSAQIDWEQGVGEQRGAVQCIHSCDVTADGTPDVVLGRDDGSVEVYACPDGDTPEQVYSTRVMAAVTSVAAGKVSSLSHDEVVVATFAGHVLGLNPEQQALGQPRDGHEGRVARVQQELGELEQQLMEQRAAARPADAATLLPEIAVNDKFELDRDDASYVLTIETPASLELVLLQSDVPVDLLDVAENSAVVSFSPSTQENPLLATFRCQPGVTRMQIKIRSIEGQYGTLRLYITPSTLPKMAQLRTFQIKALSLHQRINGSLSSDRPTNDLVLHGGFTFADMHSWVAFCLPDVPTKVPGGESESASFLFQSSFLGTQLECTYRRGEAVFRSDNVSTISILKDVMTKEATSRKIPLEINFELNEASMQHTLALVHPLLEHQLLLSKKVELVDALKEMSSQEEASQGFLAPEYRAILDNADELLAEFKQQPFQLERLYGIVTDLYIDRFKFKGQNVQGRVQALVELLDNYSYPTLVEFFLA